MTKGARRYALALFSLACLVGFGDEKDWAESPDSPSLNYLLVPSEIARYIADTGTSFPAQFGLPILNGVAALRPELDEYEEPPPDPQWPEPMAKGAIYFGGTDYGRFIPESLILNDGVRPDVLLMTQNQLANAVYREGLRRRVAGKCWVPQESDGTEAFNTYVQEVQSGRRPGRENIKVENGRVYVTGALAVMEINALISRSIFDHNRGGHPFYVEESYVIPWMYDYLSPHGLVMKLNSEKIGKVPMAVLRSDRDFWDWQTRRLLDDPQFCRRRAERWRVNRKGDYDLDHRVACRAFSKLRCAIAGLYAKKGHVGESQSAFHEAYALDPQSPEAIFRYLHESLLPQGKIDVAQEFVEYHMRITPDDQRLKKFHDYIGQLRKAGNRKKN